MRIKKKKKSKPTGVDDHLNPECDVKGGLQADAPWWVGWWRSSPRQGWGRSGSNISLPKSNIDMPVHLDKDLQTQMSKWWLKGCV